jgi:tetratricopeptide (TPR) repeat protein
MPDRVTPADLSESLKALLEMDRQAMAVRTLERVMDDIHDQHAWVELRAVITESLGPEVLQQTPWTGLYARVLRGCRDAKTILEISQGSDDPMVQLERAWALIFIQQFEQADAILETVIPVLTRAPLGLAYRFKASIQFEQGTDWQSTWAEVRSRLQGRELGVALLDEVYQLMQSGDGQRGRESALEAAALLERDPYHRAWAQHAIGMSYLREKQIDHAENALTEADQLSRKRRAKAFRARALCGMGSLRRLQGDLTLAEAHFREAIKHAREPDDLSEALWGVGHLLRLQQKPTQALEQFKRALRVSTAAKWIEIHRALAYLMLGNCDEAREAIIRAGPVVGATQHRLIVARAELARIEGNTALALEELRSLPSESVTAQDESQLFNELFSMLEPHPTDRAQTNPLLERRKIEISCLEQMTVHVNGRPIAINRASKSTVLLRVLLQSNTALSIETLVRNLWPESPESDLNKKLKQLSQTARELRNLFGWSNAIVMLGGTYRLDPKADWQLQSRD